LTKLDPVLNAIPPSHLSAREGPGEKRAGRERRGVAGEGKGKGKGQGERRREREREGEGEGISTVGHKAVLAVVWWSLGEQIRPAGRVI
jgi:hypothetical protein